MVAVMGVGASVGRYSGEICGGAVTMGRARCSAGAACKSEHERGRGRAGEREDKRAREREEEGARERENDRASARACEKRSKE